MATEDDVRRIAMSLPGATEIPGSADFKVGGKGFVWPYWERVDPKRPRIERRDIFVVRVAGEEIKYALIETNPSVYFTTDHYNGYAAVITRLDSIELGELEDLLADAHAAAIELNKRTRRIKRG